MMFYAVFMMHVCTLVACMMYAKQYTAVVVVVVVVLL